MNIFEYVPLMKEMGGGVAIAGVAVLVLFLGIIFFKMLGGMRQGFWRQLIRTGRFVGAAILSYIIASSISSGIIGMFDESTFNDLLNQIEAGGVPVSDSIRTMISCFNPETFEYLLLLPAAVIIVPFVFTLLFIVINNILKIVSAILIKILGFQKADSNPSRLGGAVLAAIEGILLFIILLLPVTGILSIVDEAYDIAFESEENREDAAIVEQYETIFLPFIDNPAIDFTQKLGSRALSETFATVKIDGEKANVRNDILEIIHIALVDGPALKDADFNNLTEENKAAIDSIIDSVGDSHFLSGILVGFINGMGNAMKNGIFPVEFGEFGDVMDGVVEYLSSFSIATFGEDLHTIVNVYYAISDSGVLAAMKDGNTDIMTLLDQKRQEGDDVLSEIIEVLKANKRTSKLITAMTKALITNLVPEDATIEINGEQVQISYDTVKDSVSEILSVKKDDTKTEEQFKEELGSTLDTALKNNSITLEPDVLDGIVDHINDNYDEIYSAVGEEVDGELTDEQFNNILLQYYTSYLNSMGGSQGGEGGLDGAGDINNLIPGFGN